MIRKVQLLLLSSPLVRLYPAVRRAWQVSHYLLRRPVTHGDDFAAFARFAARPGLFLDVGASSGTSAMSFRVFNRRSRILSIEPNATLEKELRFLKRIVRGFDYLIAAAGDQRGTITMYVPFYRGVALTAYTASSREDLMDQRGGLHDWLAATLERCHPILLVERSGDFEAIQHLLKASGYSAYGYQAHVGRFVAFASLGAGPNVFFMRPDAIPRDAVGRSGRPRRRARDVRRAGRGVTDL